MNRKLLVILLCAISVQTLNTAHSEIQLPFARNEIIAGGGRSTRPSIASPSAGLTQEEETHFADTPEVLDMMKLLRNVPREQPKPSRPSTAPAKMNERTHFDKLHDN